MMWRCLQVLLLALLLVPASASAHSSLESTTPEDGATVTRAPSQITLTFSNDVKVPDGSVSVVDLHGKEYVERGITVDGAVAHVPVDDAGSGTRVVSWRAITDHGTDIFGSFSYNIDELDKGADHAAAASGHPAKRELTNFARAVTGSGLVLALVVTLWLLVRRLRDRADTAQRSLLVGIAVMTVFAAAVGAVTGGRDLLTGTDEPEPTRFEQQVELGGEGSAVVSVEPTVAGQTSVTVRVLDADGSPHTTAESVTMRYQPADERIGQFRATLDSDGGGVFSSDEILVPFGGRWAFTVNVSEDKFSSSIASFEVHFQRNEAFGR